MLRDTNWYKELTAIDEKEKIVAIAYDGKKYKSLDEIKDKIDYNFDSGYGGEEGFAFTAWTKNRFFSLAAMMGQNGLIAYQEIHAMKQLLM